MPDHASLFLLVTVLVLASILAIFGMKYFVASRIARAGAAGDMQLRALADRATAAQAKSAEALQALHADLAAVKTQVAAIERLLREVA